jgi:hypothetical protein
VAAQTSRDGKPVQVSADNQCACRCSHDRNFLQGAERRTASMRCLLIMRAGKFEFSDERIADSSAIANRLAGDELH